MERLIVVADDLTGAADCGVAFAQRGFETRAVLDPGAVSGERWDVLALDTDTRDAPALVAERRVREHVAAVAANGQAIFKKVDSTLRGNVAAELRAAVTTRKGSCVVAAPAFPATGRTTREARQLLDGVPLERSEFAEQMSTSVLSHLLAPVGLPVREVTLQEVRDDRVGELVKASCADAGGVLICDAETEGDLERVAEGGVESGSLITWMGTAGLARALAAALASSRASLPSAEQRLDRPLLLVVGSAASATREQLRRLRERKGICEVIIDPGRSACERAAERIGAALAAGRDCALTLKSGDGTLDFGRAGSRALAAVAAPAIRWVGGLVLTGGETARAVLEAVSVQGLRLERELAPGVALGRIDPPSSLPVALKAGGFGDEQALVFCREALKSGSPR